MSITKPLGPRTNDELAYSAIKGVRIERRSFTPIRLKLREIQRRIPIRDRILDSLRNLNGSYGAVDQAADDIVKLIQNNYRRRPR